MQISPRIVLKNVSFRGIPGAQPIAPYGFGNLNNLAIEDLEVFKGYLME
jgi:hypothetical protein